MDNKIAGTEELYARYPRIRELTMLGASFAENDLNSFLKIRGIYVIERQLMFLDENVEDIIRKFNGVASLIEKELKPKIAEIIAKTPYLEDSNLMKEFNIQVISTILSYSRIKCLFDISSSENEALELAKKDVEYVEKYHKFNLNDIEKAKLSKIKSDLMKKLDVKKSDFSMCFTSDSLVMIIDE